MPNRRELTTDIVKLRGRATAQGWSNVAFLLELAQVAAAKEETRPGSRSGIRRPGRTWRWLRGW